MLTANVLLLLLLLLLLWLLYLDVGALCWSVRGGGAPLLLLLLAEGPCCSSCFHQSSSSTWGPAGHLLGQVSIAMNPSCCRAQKAGVQFLSASPQAGLGWGVGGRLLLQAQNQSLWNGLKLCVATGLDL
jgi:hypothetical protein